MFILFSKTPKMANICIGKLFSLKSFKLTSNSLSCILKNLISLLFLLNDSRKEWQKPFNLLNNMSHRIFFFSTTVCTKKKTQYVFLIEYFKKIVKEIQ